MTATRSGIPTTYLHTEFRSRLEARWAAFFDLVGWSWVYEPVDAQGYIPDFLIQGDLPMFVEVGPCVVARDFEAKSRKPDENARTLGHDVLIVGVSPLVDAYDLDRSGSGVLCAGLLGEHSASWGGLEDDDDFEPGFSWDPAAWAWGARGLGVFSSIGWYAHRPHHDGHEGSLDDRCGYPPHGERGTSLLKRLWAEAGNSVRWRR